MCDFRITESVRQSILGRRSFLATAMGLGCVATAPDLSLAAESRDWTFRTLADLTHTLHEDFPTYFGQSQFSIDRKFSVGKEGLNLNEWKLSEHVGTHIDAPLHFSNDGKDVSEIPLDSLMVPLVIIDIRKKSSESPDSQVTPADIKSHIKEYGPLPPHCCVAMHSGWAQLVSSDRFRGQAADGLHFPGFHEEAARLLLEESQAIGIAVDTLSLDYGLSKQFDTHKFWLPTGRWGLECLNLSDMVPVRGAFLFVGCPKVKSGTGGPSRVAAFIP